MKALFVSIMSMKKTFLILFIILTTLSVFAQKSKVENLQRFDNKKFHFGFSLGFNGGGFALHRRPYDELVDSAVSIEVVNQSGFNLGIVTDLHIGTMFNIRFIPTLVFAQRNLSYTFLSKDDELFQFETPIESTYIDIPILFKYRSIRLNNFAAYFIAGAKYSIDLASNEDVNNADIPESIIKLKKNTTSAEVGIGTDFFLPYFKFGIELKMSYTLDDALIHDNTELSNPIEKISPKMFFLTFLFEG
jgi:hypothetical protein